MEEPAQEDIPTSEELKALDPVERTLLKI